MTKSDYADALGTLLCLDRPMTKDLGKLETDTLTKMYYNYVQNAKDYNNKMEKVVETLLGPAATTQDAVKVMHNA